MKKIQPLTDEFFKELADGKLASAERILQRIKSEKGMKEHQIGYVTALNGMLLAAGSRSDQLTLMNRTEVEDSGKLEKIFSKHSRNMMLNDFDRGFFSAWVDYFKTLRK